MKMPVLQSEDVSDREAIQTVNSAESVVSKENSFRFVYSLKLDYKMILLQQTHHLSVNSPLTESIFKLFLQLTAVTSIMLFCYQVTLQTGSKFHIMINISIDQCGKNVIGFFIYHNNIQVKTIINQKDDRSGLDAAPSPVRLSCD